MIAFFYFSTTATHVNNDLLSCLSIELFSPELNSQIKNKLNKISASIGLNEQLSTDLTFTTDVQSQLSQIFTRFSSLPQNIKENISRCGINAKPAESRCELVHGKGNCERINHVTFVQKCSSNEIRHEGFFCYHRCPSDLIEQGVSCKKPESKLSEYNVSKT